MSEVIIRMAVNGVLSYIMCELLSEEMRVLRSELLGGVR